MNTPSGKRLVIIGGTGNGALVLSTMNDINRAGGNWQLAGFLNDFEQTILGYPVLGKADAAGAAVLIEQPDVLFIWALFSPNNRAAFAERLESLGIPANRWATLIHPSVVVSDTATLGNGVCIHPQAAIAPGVRVGDHVTVFAQAYLAHDAKVDRYGYVSNNASVGASVHMREGAYAGTGCLIREHVQLGEWSMAGMGSVVIRDVSPKVTVVGNPASPLLQSGSRDKKGEQV